MTISHLLEDFTPLSSADNQAFDAALEDTHLAAFEKGYQAGWEDSTHAHTSEAGKISAELVQKIHDIDFTYQEAFTHISTSLQSVIETLLRVTLPSLADQSLNANILAEISNVIATYEQPEIVLAVAPHDRAALGALLEGRVTNLKNITEDRSLDPGMIVLRVAHDEHLIDIRASTEKIANLMADFFNTVE